MSRVCACGKSENSVIHRAFKNSIRSGGAHEFKPLETAQITEEFRQGFEYGQSYMDNDGCSTGTAEEAWEEYKKLLGRK